VIPLVEAIEEGKAQTDEQSIGVEGHHKVENSDRGSNWKVTPKRVKGSYSKFGNRRGVS